MAGNGNGNKTGMTLGAWKAKHRQLCERIGKTPERLAKILPARSGGEFNQHTFSQAWDQFNAALQELIGLGQPPLPVGTQGSAPNGGTAPAGARPGARAGRVTAGAT